MRTTTERPLRAGPEAACARPGSAGVGGSSPPAAERVRDDLRRGVGSCSGTTLQPIRGGKRFTQEDHPRAIATAVNEVLRPQGSGAREQGTR